MGEDGIAHCDAQLNVLANVGGGRPKEAIGLRDSGVTVRVLRAVKERPQVNGVPGALGGHLL